MYISSKYLFLLKCFHNSINQLSFCTFYMKLPKNFVLCFITFLHVCVFILFFLYPFVSLVRRLLPSLKYTRRQNNAKSLYELYFQVKTKNLFISSIVRLKPCKALWRHWSSRGRLLLFVSFFGARTSLISIFILFVVVYFSSSFPLQVILLKGDILVQNIYLYFLVWTVWFKSHCSGGDVSSNLSFWLKLTIFQRVQPLHSGHFRQFLNFVSFFEY